MADKPPYIDCSSLANVVTPYVSVFMTSWGMLRNIRAPMDRGTTSAFLQTEDDVRLVRNANGPYRAGGECSGRGTTNQGEPRTHDVIEICGKGWGSGERERRTVRNGERVKPLANVPGSRSPYDQ